MALRWKPITWNEECNRCGQPGTRYAREKVQAVWMPAYGIHWKPATGEGSQGGQQYQVVVACQNDEHIKR